MWESVPSNTVGELPPGPILYAGAYVVLHRLDVFARGNHENADDRRLYNPRGAP